MIDISKIRFVLGKKIQPNRQLEKELILKKNYLRIL